MTSLRSTSIAHFLNARSSGSPSATCSVHHWMGHVEGKSTGRNSTGVRKSYPCGGAPVNCCHSSSFTSGDSLTVDRSPSLGVDDSAFAIAELDLLTLPWSRVRVEAMLRRSAFALCFVCLSKACSFNLRDISVLSASIPRV